MEGGKSPLNRQDHSSLSEEAEDGRQHAEREFFKIVTIPPPRPLKRGEVKNVQSTGTKSEKGVRSPTFIQNSVINIKVVR